MRELRQAEVHLSRILTGHYLRLLAADGDEYPDLLRSAYASAAAYQGHLAELADAEQRVADSAMLAGGDNPEAGQLLGRIQAARSEFRQEELRSCFPPSGLR